METSRAGAHPPIPRTIPKAGGGAWAELGRAYGWSKRWRYAGLRVAP